VSAGSTSESSEEGEAQESGAEGSGYLSLWRRPDVRLYTGLVATTYGLLYGAVTLYIVRAGELGLGDGSIGLFYTVMGIGTFVGSVLAGMGGYATKRALGIAGMASVVGAVAMVAFGAAGS